MADDYRKSGQSFRGVNKAQFEQEMFTQEQLNMANDLVQKLKELNEERKKGTVFDDLTNGNYAQRLSITKKLKDFEEGKRDLRRGDLRHSGLINSKAREFGNMVKQQVPFVSDMNDSYKEIKNNYGFLGRFAGPIAAFTVLAKLAYDFAQDVADIRKETGLTVVGASKLNVQNKKIYLQAKLYLLTQEEIDAAQKSIRDNLGLSAFEAADLSLNFARTAAATGQTSDNMAKNLMLFESVSSASREVLMNQMRTNSAMIQAAGIVPSLIFDDIAQNAEFFAKFAKDGGQNIVQAGIAARKLGLEMSAVASISESLLNFESSIEDSMNASMLLGREINTDRARQLALAGDQEGLMKEIQRLAGSEAEFNRMNVLQREALATALAGGDVERLSRIVRNQQSSASGEIAANSGQSKIENLTNITNQMLDEGNRIMKSGFRKLD